VNIEKLIKTYLLNCNTLHITVTIAHKLNSSMSACESLLGNESYLVNTSQMNIQLLNCLLNYITNEWIEFTNEVSFISLGGPNRSYWSPISVVAERSGDPKIPHIHGNLCWIFVDMRMSFREPLPIKRTSAWTLLSQLSGGVYRVA
jgi:hypothetical protein